MWVNLTPVSYVSHQIVFKEMQRSVPAFEVCKRYREMRYFCMVIIYPDITLILNLAIALLKHKKCINAKLFQMVKQMQAGLLTVVYYIKVK